MKTLATPGIISAVDEEGLRFILVSTRYSSIRVLSNIADNFSDIIIGGPVSKGKWSYN